jgi:hypothetical protein
MQYIREAIMNKEGLLPSVLMFGKNETLLETRRQILRKAGVVVDVTYHVEDVERYLVGTCALYSLLIVCHTACEDENKRIDKRAAQRPDVAIFKPVRLVSPKRFLGHVKDSYARKSTTRFMQ